MTEEAFQVLPAVDLLGGEAVRLEQGDFERVAARARPEELVRRFASAGAPLIHVVDLDGVREGGIREDVIGRLVATAGAAKLQVSGGIRSPADAERLLAVGAARVVVGTAAFAKPEALERFVAELGDRLVVAIDVRAGRVSVGGWLEDTGLKATEVAARCAEAGASRILCTAIERDGMLGGPDLDLLREVRDASRLPVLAAGGIRSEDDLAAVAAVGCEGAVVGRALLDGSLPLAALV
ncbi:MAG TPA: 1-(5-phosphoribosyl)-5-[(5-phosphoribosylamino)methylideneamino] imidazole-4-carboxamide isomerase [Gaiellaceae bacterium]|jgi:phosphoribosylformimino-5-aminoimidazole carboxamide ribotide isomerase